MLFDFRFRPLAEVVPWSSDGEQCLHWFGLTDGWYWLNVGTDTLFQFTEVISHEWGIPPSDEPERNCVDYQIVRLWEDLLDILPHILEPIPERVLRRLSPGREALRWRERLSAPLFANMDDDDSHGDAVDRLERATGWIERRWLDVGYLRAGPRIWFWSDAKSVHVHWDNQDLTISGLPVWTATRGTLTLSLPEFVEEVRSFDERLIRGMEERVRAVQSDRTRTRIRIDVPQLLHEQRDRAAWLDRALKRAAELPPTPWDEVVAACDESGHSGPDASIHQSRDAGG